MKVSIQKLISVVLLSLLSNLLVSAQSNTGTIQGVAEEPNGAVIPNARITATLKNSQKVQTPLVTKSNDSGEFRFSNLPFGLYELELYFYGNSFKKQVEVKPGKRNGGGVVIKALLVTEACSGEPKTPSKLVDDRDKSEIVRQMLREYVDTWLRQDGVEKLIISTHNIKPKWIDSEYKTKLQLMKEAEIQRLADTTKDFTYLKFSELKVRGGCVAISLDNSWAVGKNSPYGYSSGEGKTHEFRKVDGRWVGKFVIGWIS